MIKTNKTTTVQLLALKVLRLTPVLGPVLLRPITSTAKKVNLMKTAVHGNRSATVTRLTNSLEIAGARDRVVTEVAQQKLAHPLTLSLASTLIITGKEPIPTAV